MDFRRLEIFRAVARRGNLRHAASQLGITLPAVSIQIKKLEEELGAALFHHLPNKLILTEQGRSFQRNLDGVFEALERATTEVSGKSESGRGNVSIALGTDLSRYFAPRIAEFVKANPSIDFALKSRSSSKGLSMVIDKEVDMSVGFYRSLPKGLERIPLLQTGISILYPRSMKLDGDDKEIFEQISAQRMLMLPRTSTGRRMIQTVLEEHDLDFSSSIEVGGCQAIIEFARLGLGIGMVHTICACTEAHEDLCVKDMTEHFGALDVALAIRSETLLSLSHQGLIDTLQRGHNHFGESSTHQAADAYSIK